MSRKDDVERLVNIAESSDDESMLPIAEPISSAAADEFDAGQNKDASKATTRTAENTAGNASTWQRINPFASVGQIENAAIPETANGPSTSISRDVRTNGQLQPTAATTRNRGEEVPTFHVRSRTAAVNLLHDNVYESLDYEVYENVLYLEEQRRTNNVRFNIRKDRVRWFIFIMIGVFTALIACSIDIPIEELSALKYTFLKKAVDASMARNSNPNGNLVIPYLYWLGLSIIPVMVGACLVTYVEPIAAGSGIPHVKSYLNGVKIPRIVRIKTLIVKGVGVITAVVGGLVGGKEGPMVHAGAVVAAGLSQGKSTTFIKDFRIFRAFRDDHEKRDFVLGGAAAGVAAAFGSPIGGMLFSLEEAASFWNQNLIWRTLVASIISSFTLNIVLSAYHGLTNFTFTGLFNLGKFDQSLTFQYFELPIFMLFGITGGLLGAAWNALNQSINKFRARFIKWKWIRVVEAMLVAVLGVTLACVMAFFINDCRPLGNDPTDYPVQLFCEDNEYNAVAALWFQTPEATVRSLFHDPPGSHKILSLAIFTLVYYILACMTFGLNVSLGIFIPTVLVGAAWGRLVAMVLFYIFPEAVFLSPGKYALIGAAANLGGVLRMTISLSVILMETTGVDTSFFFPLIVTLISAKWVGDYFNEGIYDIQIRTSNVPVLPWQALPEHKDLKASHIMSSPVICIKKRDQAKYIYNILRRCNHNGFPVVEDVQGNNRANGRVCGFVLRSQLIVILLQSLYEEKKRFWEKEISIQTFRDVYPRYPSIDCVKMRKEKEDYTINLDIFMNPAPVRVFEHDSVPKSFNKFRALGLRHMVVIDHENRVLGIITRKDFLYK